MSYTRAQVEIFIKNNELIGLTFEEFGKHINDFKGYIEGLQKESRAGFKSQGKRAETFDSLPVLGFYDISDGVNDIVVFEKLSDIPEKLTKDVLNG